MIEHKPLVVPEEQLTIEGCRAYLLERAAELREYCSEDVMPDYLLRSAEYLQRMQQVLQWADQYLALKRKATEDDRRMFRPMYQQVHGHL